jgi:serine/threonine protein kinase
VAAAGAIDADATWGLKAGDALGEDLRVLTFLAAGRKSEVYLAWDRKRRSTVAAKLLRPGRPVGKLRKEAALLERLAHPVLVRGFGATLEEPLPHLVLEHIEGPSVRGLIRRGAVAPDIVVEVALQVATALHYLAMEGFVHLDVKPQNILLDTPAHRHTLESGWRQRRTKRLKGSPPRARLIDAAAIQPVGSVVKALGAAVPELRLQGSRASPPAGVWLLGATMWRMLSGGAKVPGEENDPRGGRRARGSPTASMGPPVFPEGAPEPLLDLVRACLSPEPSERPSAGDLADGLEPLVISFPAPSSPPPARPAARLRRWLVPPSGG